MSSTLKANSDSWDKTSAVAGGSVGNLSQQGGGQSGGYGIPDESEEKIQYAFRIILEAHRARTMTNDNEIRSLRQTIEEVKIANANLTKKYAAAEREIMEQQHRNQVLSKDNENLAIANRQLIQRCEKYKRIQQTFSEALENSGHEDDMPAMPDYRTTVSNFTSVTTSSLPTPTALNALPTMPSMQVGPPLRDMSPKTNPAPVERSNSNGASAGPAATSFDSNGKDGKQFFRIVRTRLPFEAFNSFLSIIKKLNSHEFSREVAVEEAKKIFGADNQDLLGDFQALISRHISA